MIKTNKECIEYAYDKGFLDFGNYMDLKEEIENMSTLENKFNVIYNDVLKFKGFVAILKADKEIYQRRIEHRKRIYQDYSIEKAILDRINAELELLKEED